MILEMHLWNGGSARPCERYSLVPRPILIEFEMIANVFEMRQRRQKKDGGEPMNSIECVDVKRSMRRDTNEQVERTSSSTAENGRPHQPSKESNAIRSYATFMDEVLPFRKSRRIERTHFHRCVGKDSQRSHSSRTSIHLANTSAIVRSTLRSWHPSRRSSRLRRRGWEGDTIRALDNEIPENRASRHRTLQASGTWHVRLQAVLRSIPRYEDEMSSSVDFERGFPLEHRRRRSTRFDRRNRGGRGLRW